MCGRYSIFAVEDDIADVFGIDLFVDNIPAPSWNVAPSQKVPVVMERVVTHNQERERQLRALHWGLIPSWTKTPGKGLINARAETLLEKPSFRAAAVRHRCLIPANGYYEWQVSGRGVTDQNRSDWGKKTPFFLSAAEVPSGPFPLLAFAGIYEAWADQSLPTDHPEYWRRTVAIITRAATAELALIHDRMPVVVPPELFDPWLNPLLTDKDAVGELLTAIPPAQLHFHEVGRAVGNIRVNSPNLIAPIEV